MNKRGIVKHLNRKIEDWLESITDQELAKKIRSNILVTGGAIVSLLNGDEVNDYDIYFKNYETCLAVAEYYVDTWNKTHDTQILVIKDHELFTRCQSPSRYFKYFAPDKGLPEFEGKSNDVKLVSENEYELPHCETRLKFKNSIAELIKFQADILRTKRISFFIRSVGAVVEKDESAVDDQTEPSNDIRESVNTIDGPKPKYRPRYFSTNALSLSDKIQLIIRFTGTIEDIHENFDFLHCKGAFDFGTNELSLPAEVLLAIINKELIYQGSKYPLCSIIRTRKFITRGYTINAGQYVKMALELQAYDLHDPLTFADQLVGVDSFYFDKMIAAMYSKQLTSPDYKIDMSYLMTLIDRIFG